MLLSLAGIACANGATLMEVAFSVQNNDLVWFSVEDPSVQGKLDFSGMPAGAESNALAYDAANNRLLFVNGMSLRNHGVYAVELDGLQFVPGTTLAVTANVVGNIPFTNPQQLLGGGFFGSSYYSLIDGGDSLLKVDFDVTGAVLNTSAINLPGTRQMLLGDLAFDAAGGLWISGFNENGSSAGDDRLWHYSTTDGVNFTYESTVDPAGTRFNGIFIGADGSTLYGYRSASNTFGAIDTTTGAATTIYTGSPFQLAGDLSNGFMLEIVPEPSACFLAAGGMGVALLRRRRQR